MIAWTTVALLFGPLVWLANGPRSVMAAWTGEKMSSRGVRIRYDGEEDCEFVLMSPEVDRGPAGLSTDAPLGRALLGRRAGERITFRAPDGVCGVSVVAVISHNGEAL
jgi:hypothetical protein